MIQSHQCDWIIHRNPRADLGPSVITCASCHAIDWNALNHAVQDRAATARLDGALTPDSTIEAVTGYDPARRA